MIERQHFPRFDRRKPGRTAWTFEEAGMLDAAGGRFQVKTGAAFAWGERYSAFDFSDTFSHGKPTTFQAAATSTNCWPIRPRCRAWTSATAKPSSVSRRVPLRACAPRGRQRVPHQGNFMLDASGYGRVLPRLLDLEAPSNFPVRQAVFTHVEDRIDSPTFDRTKILVTTHPDNAISGSGPSRSATALLGRRGRCPAHFDGRDITSTPACAVSSTRRPACPAC
jgi:hypothetical protein